MRFTPILLIFIILAGSSCSNTAYVHQNQQTFNDYKVYKYKKIESKTKKPDYTKYSKKKKDQL